MTIEMVAENSPAPTKFETLGTCHNILSCQSRAGLHRALIPAALIRATFHFHIVALHNVALLNMKMTQIEKFVYIAVLFLCMVYIIFI
jgi:hypothetical protein